MIDKREKNVKTAVGRRGETRMARIGRKTVGTELTEDMT
jgi:hypothetical protein